MENRLIGVNERGLRVGQDHQRAKLTDASVELIRQLREGGMTYRSIAQKFEVSAMMVCYICNYKRRVSTVARWRSL